MILIDLILVVLAIPVGFLIAWMARDELVIGRKYFWMLIMVSVPGILVFSFLGMFYVSFTMAFVFVIAMISVVKSKQRSWTRKPF